MSGSKHKTMKVQSIKLKNESTDTRIRKNKSHDPNIKTEGIDPKIKNNEGPDTNINKNEGLYLKIKERRSGS